MTKCEFVKLFAEKLADNEIKLSRVNADLCATLVFALVQNAVREDGEFRWPGFGTFKRTTRAARVARNPRTGEAVEVPEKDAVTFKAAPQFIPPSK